VVFRHVVKEAGAPDVFFTEFTNSDSYCHPEGKDSVRVAMLPKNSCSSSYTPFLIFSLFSTTTCRHILVRNIANFWATLPKPFFVLAPMEDVTDVVFRHVVKEAGAPDVFFTEFTKFLLIFIYSVSDFFFIFNDNLSTYSGAKHCYYTGILAPMEDVTDVVFRHVVKEAGAPDVFFTEFTNSDSYCHPEV
jgi:tRNA-dihydrouridine synthase